MREGIERLSEERPYITSLSNTERPHVTVMTKWQQSVHGCIDARRKKWIGVSKNTAYEL